MTDIDFDDSAALAVRMGATLMELMVRSVQPISPTMVRVELAGDGLKGLSYRPGQDLMLTAVTGPPSVRRRWTIRSLDSGAGTVAIDVALHGSAGASRLHESVPGDVVEAIGPRGKVHLVDDAEVHVFLGDLSYLPAAYAMAEAVQAPATAVVVLAVAPGTDRLPLTAAACPQGSLWVDSASDDAATGRALLDASGLAEPQVGHVAYAGGEMTMVSTIRSALTRDHGWDRESVLPKPYWRRGTPNARHGEPGRD